MRRPISLWPAVLDRRACRALAGADPHAVTFQLVRDGPEIPSVPFTYMVDVCQYALIGRGLTSVVDQLVATTAAVAGGGASTGCGQRDPGLSTWAQNSSTQIASHVEPRRPDGGRSRVDDGARGRREGGTGGGAAMDACFDYQLVHPDCDRDEVLAWLKANWVDQGEGQRPLVVE